MTTGYDSAGIFIRDSSGWETRYLSWSRLYGEVGFSGWVVGMAPTDRASAIKRGTNALSSIQLRQAVEN